MYPSPNNILQHVLLIAFGFCTAYIILYWLIHLTNLPLEVLCFNARCDYVVYIFCIEIPALFFLYVYNCFYMLNSFKYGSFGAIVLALMLSLITFSCLHYQFEFLVDSAPRHLTMAESSYYATTVWTTLGANSISPMGYGKAITAFETVSGYVFNGLFIVVIIRKFQLGKPE